MVQTNLGVMVFAATGAGEAGIVFSDYHHYENLAQDATYTPPAQSQSIFGTNLNIQDDRMHIDFYDGGSWLPFGTGQLEKTPPLFQDTDQNLRVENSHTSAGKISLTGVIWTAGFTDYHYYANLAGAATYTPPVKSIASICGTWCLTSSAIGLEAYDGGGWFSLHFGTVLERISLLSQDDTQSIRVKNGSGSNQKFSLTGVIWT